MGATDPDLVAYCGLYCNACAIRQGKIKEHISNLRDFMATYGVDKSQQDIANWEPKLKHYQEFNQVLDGLVRVFGDCPCCLQGWGDPGCKIRVCAKQRGYHTCAECDEAETCENLDPYRRHLDPVLDEIRKKGIENYAEEMQKNVDEGYSFQIPS